MENMKTQIFGNILKRYGKFKVISALNYLFHWQNGKFNSSGMKAKKWPSQEIVKNRHKFEQIPHPYGIDVLVMSG